jgi:hypothetical protein
MPQERGYQGVQSQATRHGISRDFCGIEAAKLGIERIEARRGDFINQQ